MKKLITFTIPCYNSAAYMNKCIDSLLGHENIEIIIIDDGSKDETGAIADSYALKYPETVRVIHQENGGHGEGINQGIRHAAGTYFKVIDSDDWVDRDALNAVLSKLEELERENGVDLMVTNYVYEHTGGGRQKVIDYANVFPDNQAITWDQTRRFHITQYLTIHSCIYRTEVLRKSGLVLPKHIFYEDNLFIYAPLPFTKRICYMNQNFYHYLIGREGQSVSEQMLIKRGTHQILISTLIFKAHRLQKIKRENPRLYKYMYHELCFMMVIATIFTRMSRTDEAEKQVREMWEDVSGFDSAFAKKVRYRSIAALVNFPGKIGRSVSIFFYHFAHSVIKFN